MSTLLCKKAAVRDHVLVPDGNLIFPAQSLLNFRRKVSQGLLCCQSSQSGANIGSDTGISTPSQSTNILVRSQSY